MKNFFCFIFIFFGAIGHVSAQSSPACGNNSQGGTAPSPPCPSGNTQHAIHVYTGNERREIKDIQVWGSIGQAPLTWTRYYNSRFVNSTNDFGSNQTWRHGYEWEISVTSDGSGPVLVNLYYPNGVNNRFTRVGTTNKFVSTPAVTDILFLTDATTFTLQRANGFQYVFKYVSVGSGMIWQPSYFLDSQQNVYTFTYDTKNRLVKVSDATGRYLKITWQQLSLTSVGDTALAVLSSTAPADGQWTTVASASGTPFRYLRYQGYDHTYSSVAEIKFLGTDGMPLSGTPFGSGFDQVAGHDFSEAFDGDTSTYFVSSVPTRDYAGSDLGTTASVGSIQFFPRSGHAADMERGRFIGSNTKPATINVITQVETSDGRSVAYDYASFDDAGTPQNWETLAAVHYGDGTSAAYTYVQPYPLTRPLVSIATDPRAVDTATTLQWQYDNTQSNIVGFVIGEMNGATGETMLSVDSPNGYDAIVAYANGGSTTIGTGHQTSLVNSTSDSLNRQASYTYDQSGYGFLTSATDSLSRTTHYTRTAYGNLLSVTYPDSSTESWTRDDLDLVLTHTDGLGRVTTFTRDTQHRVTRIDYPDGSFETLAYNSFGEVTSHRQRNGGTESNVYDARGLKTSHTDALANVTSYTYDANDRLATVTDALNHTTSYAYNERGWVTAVSHADGSVTTYGYDAYGNRTSTTNELTNTWTRVYDEFRRLKSSTDPLNRTTSYGYELPGGICGCTHSDALPTSITLPSGKKQTFTYDSEWQKTSETTGAGTADAATTLYAYDNAGNVTSRTDPKGNVWSYAYDSRNRRISETDPLGHATLYAYDAVGNVTQVTRPDGGVTTNTYDTMNRLLTTTDPKGETTSYTYDLAGNLLTRTDASNNTYTYTYDALNRVTSLTYPDGSHEDYGYDVVGNRVTYTNRAGATRTSVFDNRNRETSVTWSDGTPGVTRTYDAAGRLLTSDNGVSSSSYSYDDANELLSETQTNAVLGAPWAVDYTYDADGHRASVTYPSGFTLAYAYTGRNQVSGLTGASGSVASYTYDLAGNVLTKTLADGTTATSTYDAGNRLTDLDHTLSGASFAQFDYAYDVDSRRTSEQRDAAVTDTYTYDAVDQVTGVAYGSGRTVGYTYDATGNRTTVTDTVNGNTSYATNNLNQYTTVGAAAYGYDANGNLTSGNGLYIYDAQNRLESAAVGGNTDSFFYDSRNRVVERIVNGSPVYLIYDGWNLIEERDASGNLLATYVHGARTDELLSKVDASGNAVYYHANALGSTACLTEASGTVVEKYTYDVFGRPTITDGSGNTLTASAYGNRFLFTGREWLAEVSLYDYRNRVYSADLGRFLQTDPMSFSAGDVNVYRYCGNSPLNGTDPMGLCEGYGEVIDGSMDGDTGLQPNATYIGPGETTMITDSNGNVISVNVPLQNSAPININVNSMIGITIPAEESVTADLSNSGEVTYILSPPVTISVPIFPNPTVDSVTVASDGSYVGYTGDNGYGGLVNSVLKGQVNDDYRPGMATQMITKNANNFTKALGIQVSK